VKSWLVADRYLHELSANAVYARLHNLRLRVRRELSAALERYDLLLTPTVPITAPRLLEGPASFVEIAARTSAALCFNTAPLNLSGHPALSVPSGADARMACRRRCSSWARTGESGRRSAPRSPSSARSGRSRSPLAASEDRSTCRTARPPC
jgi:hypothetical protein